MARRKSPFSGFPQMPPLPKPLKMPRLYTRRSREYDEVDDEEDDNDDRYVTRVEFEEERERREEERERAYRESPEGIAEREKNTNRRYYFWNEMLMIWITRPYEMMKYLFNRLFKHPYDSIGIGHFISVALWVIIIWVSFEIYQMWEKIPFFSDYIVSRVLLIVVLITAIYLYCKLKTWWKVR